MEYRSLGRTGVKVSPLCLGTDNFMDPTPEDECERILNTAMDAGINLLNIGDDAGGESERTIGRILKRNGRRHEMLIGREFDILPEEHTDSIRPNEYGLSRLNVIRACEESLKRLQTDYIDLYQVHRPSSDIPVDETLGALNDLVRQGKVRYIGCSTHPAWMVMEAIMVSESKGWVRYVTEQSPYNLLDRRIENELIPMAQKWGLGLITWAPMGIGVLAGRYLSDTDYPEGSKADLRGGFYADRVTRRGIEVGRAFSALAADAGLSAAQLAILWCKDQPGITAPLIGPRTIQHIEQLIPVLDMQLSDDLRAACDELVPPGSAVADFHNTANWMKMTVSV
jgi:aryl-alcohol dehydrogenase-like predicted oxidoreductase